MTNDPNASQHSRIPTARQPLEKLSSAQISRPSTTAEYFSDLTFWTDRPNEVTSITDPYALLGWLVMKAKLAGRPVLITDGVMRVVEELIRQVRYVGYLPSNTSDFLRTMLDLLFAPGNEDQANVDLVLFIRRILLEGKFLDRQRELHSLIRSFAKIAGLRDSLKIDIRESEVHITSSRALRRSQRVTVDVWIGRIRRY